jgi:hypothetical protein
MILKSAGIRQRIFLFKHATRVNKCRNNNGIPGSPKIITSLHSCYDWKIRWWIKVGLFIIFGTKNVYFY